jgi:CRISPR-associated protein Csh2
MKEKKMNNKELFTNRVYGVQIIKSKNSNYNADFTGSPRTLPDGTVYSTDKVDKFNIRKYLGRNDDSLIFTKTTYKNDLKPMVLKEVYEHHFGDIGKDKTVALRNLLLKLDVRLFGATFAPKGADNMNISIHGPVQVSYGTNRFLELRDSGMYTDQIGSPYASKEGAAQSTLGSQTRSQEAHYVHHFSINPKNLSSYVNQFQNNDKNIQGESSNDQEEDFQLLLKTDIQLLKKAMAVATTYYDSTSKKDSENELLLWIELNEGSEKVFKNFTDLINVENVEVEKVEKNKIFIKEVFTEYIGNHADAISKIELAYDRYNTTLDFDYENGQDILFKDGVTSKFKCKIVHTDNIENRSKETSGTKDSETKDNAVPFIIYEDLNLIKSTYDILNKSNDENK